MSYFRIGCATRYFVVIVALLCSAAAFAADVQYIRDTNGTLIGRVITRRDGLIEARSAQNMFLGRFDPHTNETRDANNRLVAKGNMLAALISDNVRAQPVAPGAEQYREPPQRSGFDRHVPSGNRGVVLPHVQERRASMSVTQLDRRLAAEMFQHAGDNRGKEYFWRNPETGNHGSIIIFPDFKFNDIFVHGEQLQCYLGRMTLHVGNATEIQRQVICKFSHNDMWMTVQVEED